MSEQSENLRRKIILAALKYTSYFINILLVGSVVGFFIWYGSVLVASVNS